MASDEALRAAGEILSDAKYSLAPKYNGGYEITVTPKEIAGIIDAAFADLRAELETHKAATAKVSELAMFLIANDFVDDAKELAVPTAIRVIRALRAERDALRAALIRAVDFVTEVHQMTTSARFTDRHNWGGLSSDVLEFARAVLAEEIGKKDAG